MNISGMISGLKQKAHDREERKAKAVSEEYKKLNVEAKFLKKRAQVYTGRAREKRNVSQLKKEVRLAKAQNNPLGRVGLAVAKNIKKGRKKSGKTKSGSSFLSNVGGVSPYALHKPVVKKKPNKKSERIVIYVNK